MFIDRHQPKQFTTSAKQSCTYCHRTPALWHYHGSEKVCAHCGTRVYISTSRARQAKSAQR